VGQTSLWRRTALGPLSAPAPPPEVGGEPSLHPPSVAPAARLEPPPQATGTYWPGLLGRRAHLARDGRGCGALVATYPPIRPGAAGWASGIPAGSPLPRGPFWPSPFLRGSTPRGFRYSPSGEASFPLSGESPRPGPPPSWRRGRPWGWKPPGYRSRLSARVDEMSPSATPPGSRYPDGSRFGQPIRLVSPSGAAAYLSEPSGFPRTAQVSPAYAFRHHPGPQPVRRLAPRGSPVSPPLLGRAPL
jgi:hypothetical protein